MTVEKEPGVGGAFEDFAESLGIRGEIYGIAAKRVIAWQLEEARKAHRLTKSAMADLMKTSRSQVDRVLDGENRAVTLEMIERAAAALGKRLKIELVDAEQ